MSIIRPIFVSISRPALSPMLPPRGTTEETLLYLRGADGSMTLVDGPAQAGTIVSFQDLPDAVVLEVHDTAVTDETVSTVTLEFGD